MNLIYFPHPMLSTKTDEVTEDTELNLSEIKEQMRELMLASRGIGLSANQVDLNAQLFVMGQNKSDVELVVNPTVLQCTKETVTESEGCLSFPNIFMPIKRPKEILVEYRDENFELHRQHLTGYSVKVFLHEWDHLQGVTFKDHVSPMKYKMAAKKAKKYGPT